MNIEPLIEVLDVTRSDPVGQRVLLNAVSVSVYAGDRLGLSGPSGSGKSTLLRAIAQLDPLQSGLIRYQGSEVLPEQIPEYRRNVAYLPQRAITTKGTVRDNFIFACSLKVSEQAYQEDLALAYVQRFERDQLFLDQEASSLSGGEQQIVAWIRCLLTEPRMILFDEPTASLDLQTQRQFENEVIRWFEETPTCDLPNKSFIWAGHDRSQLERITDNRFIMIDGRLVRESHE